MEGSFLEKLSPEVATVCEILGRAAVEFGANAYLVGGMVRDVLLDVPSLDLDIMLDKNAGEFTLFFERSWLKYFPGEVRPQKRVFFPKYLTAKLFLKGELVSGLSLLDFSTARGEEYPVPGQAPKVFPGDVATDLARRDFSVNALAVKLSPQQTSGTSLTQKSESDLGIGKVIDLFSGVADIQSKHLKVLHDKSFIEDPARLLRAVRLIGRHQFKLEARTEKLFHKAVRGNFLASLPRLRLFDEFSKLLSEPMITRVLSLLEENGLLAQIHPQLAMTNEVVRSLERYQQHSEGLKEGAKVWKRILGILFEQFSPSEYREILGQFQVGRNQIKELVDLREARGSQLAH